MTLQEQLSKLSYAVLELETAVHNGELDKAYGLATDAKWHAYQVESALEEEIGIV